MRKQFWLLILLILAVTLAGCGLEHAQEEVAEPINVAEWPTPRPTTVPSSPTPFPKITLAPTATPTERATGIATSTTPLITDKVTTSNPDEALAAQISALSGELLSPAAVAFVTADRTTLRQGPGASYQALGTVEAGELTGVLGQNPAGDWLYVLTISAAQGWLPIDALRVTGTLAEAPVLPPDPLAALISQAAASSSSSSSPGGTPAGSGSSGQTLAISDLKPVTTARVNNPILNMRQRPGAAFKLLGTLADNDEVTVLALNRDKQWALVETADKKWGWVSIDFLEPEGSLAEAPQVLTLTPAEDHPPDQVAPLVSLSGQTGAAVTTDDSGSSSPPASSPVSPAAVTSSGPALPGHTLAPVTTAQVISKVDLRRGPGTTHGMLATLTVDEKVSVLAINAQRDWVVVQATNARAGWLPVTSLAVEGSLANAPQVLTAWVDSNDIDVRRGPGIYYEAVGKLAINDLVSVLALNEGRSWVLVETLTGEQGWISRNFLTVMGSLADIPEVSPPPLAESRPVDQAEPASSQAKTTGPGKLVLQTSSGGDIMVINADGSGLRRLTNGIDPVLSPDGQTVAFTRWDGAEVGSLWTVNLDGTNERVIIGELRKAKGPEWSPDGSQIVLNFQKGGRLESKEECFNLASGSPGFPPRNASSPVMRRSEGKFFLCWTLPPDPHWSLKVVNVADGSADDLFGGTYAFRPAWDPGRTWRIVSDAGNGLLETDVNREYAQNITEEVKDGSPVFSPDGRYLAVTVGHQGGGSGYDIHRLNADGSGRVRLTETPLWVTTGPEAQPAWNHVSPAWSPDGSQIAFLTDRTGRWEIWVMNVDGSNQRPMFSDTVNDQLQISYNFVDERVLSWR